MPTESRKPLIVISYAHADEPEKPAEGEVKWLSFVTGYLRPALKHGAVDLWIDRLMPGGADWEREIAQKLGACDIFILLVSRHSLSSDYVVDTEIPIIRARQAKGEAVHFYPLVLTPTPKAGLNLVRDKNLRPRDGKPLSDLSVSERYRQMNEAADEIAEIAANFADRKNVTAARAKVRGYHAWIKNPGQDLVANRAPRYAWLVHQLWPVGDRLQKYSKTVKDLPRMLLESLILVFVVVALVWFVSLTFNVRFGEPLKFALNIYSTVVESIFGFMDPLISRALNYIKMKLDIRFIFYYHWKYIFVPMWFYFRADRKAIGSYRRSGLYIFYICWGTFVAFATSIAASTSPLSNASLLPFIFCALGLIIYQVGTCTISSIYPLPSVLGSTSKYTSAQLFSRYVLVFTLTNVLLASSVMICGLHWKESGFPGLNVALIIGLVVLMAFRDIFVSAAIAIVDRTMGQSWTDRYRELGSQRVGFYVLISVAIAAALISLDWLTGQ